MFEETSNVFHRRLELEKLVVAIFEFVFDSSDGLSDETGRDKFSPPVGKLTITHIILYNLESFMG